MSLPGVLVAVGIVVYLVVYGYARRAMIDALIEAKLAAKRTVDVLNHQLDVERDRNRILTATLIDLKMGGATLMRARMDAGHEAPARPPRSAVSQAIDENKHASSNPRLRTYLTRWSDEQLRAGKSEDTVLDALRGWSKVRAVDDDKDDDEKDDMMVATS